MLPLYDKIQISFTSAILFYVLNHPKTFELTSGITKLQLFNNQTKCRSNLGIIIHILIFFIITFLTMGDPRKNTGIKLKNTIYGSLIYFFISSPILYSLTSKLIGTKCLDHKAIIIHSLMYFLALFLVMYLP